MKRNIQIYKNKGLYDLYFEYASCGVGFLCNIKGEENNKIVKDALEVFKRLAH